MPTGFPDSFRAVALVLTALWPMLADAAPEFATCATDIAAQDYAAKERYQRDMRDMIVRSNRRLQALAVLNMRLQTALAQARRAKIAYLARRDPTRLDTNKLSRFMNFDWREKDEAALMQADTAYRKLAREVNGLKAANNDHPDWPALRTHMRDRMIKSREFKYLTQHFTTVQEANAARLATCRAINK